jgi:hypothetical protein
MSRKKNFLRVIFKLFFLLFDPEDAVYDPLDSLGFLHSLLGSLTWREAHPIGDSGSEIPKWE